MSWLHLRIDPSPKYYKFSEYTTHKRELLEKTSAGHFQPQQRTGDADESRSVRGRTAAALSSVAGLGLGDRLEANFQGTRCPGKITSNHPDGNYDSLSVSKMISPRRVSEYKSNVQHHHHHIHQQHQQHELTSRALSQQYRKQGYNVTGQSPAHDYRTQQQQNQNQNLYSFDYNQPGPFSSTPTQIIIQQPTDHLSVRPPTQQVVSIGTGFSHSNNATINRFNCSRGDFLQQTRADDCGRSGKPRAKSASRYF